jgi:hypothetical protein
MRTGFCSSPGCFLDTMVIGDALVESAVAQAKESKQPLETELKKTLSSRMCLSRHRLERQSRWLRLVCVHCNYPDKLTRGVCIGENKRRRRSSNMKYQYRTFEPTLEEARLYLHHGLVRSH